jgi:hypothetical protein
MKVLKVGHLDLMSRNKKNHSAFVSHLSYDHVAPPQADHFDKSVFVKRGSGGLNQPKDMNDEVKTTLGRKLPCVPYLHTHNLFFVNVTHTLLSPLTSCIT